MIVDLTLIMIILLAVLGLLVLVVWLLFPHGPRWLHRATDLTAELTNKDGFVGVDMEPARLVGHHGMALTDLRPAGKVLVDDRHTLDAVATLRFIPAGTRVIVTKYENAQVYVREE